jgi:hypothetical protein
MSQIPFNPMQSQAAIQNPARFPDQKLQQYAAGKPPQPTGQVTPQMAGQELAQRGAERQAISRNAAMQNNPANSPTIFQQLMMKEQMVNQQAQAIQQKEQQLGMAGAMLSKKAQDLAERERGIAALPMRPDMFTAMDGGIVFRQGGGVQGFKGGGDMSARIAEGFTEREDEPSTLGSSGVSPNDLMALIRKRMESIDEAEKTAMLSPEEKELMRFKNTQEMQKEYDEYARGRGERQQKVADALKGRAPDLGDYLGAMAAGGPGKTLAETLSRMVPGAAKLRTEYQAREMAAAKFLAEAEEKAAQADLAEKRGQRDVAAKLLQDEQTLRLKAFEIKQGAARTGIQGLAAMQESQDRQASEARRAQEAADRMALEREKFKSEEAFRAGERAFREKMVRLEASLRPKEFYNQLLGMATNPKDPNYEFAKNLLEARGGRSGAGADGRPTFDQISDNVEKRMQSTDINKIIKAAAKDPKNPRTLTEADIREMFFDEEIARAEKYYGKDVFKGMKPSKSSDAGAVDTSNPLLSGKP